jgi:hypothetical protein
MQHPLLVGKLRKSQGECGPTKHSHRGNNKCTPDQLPLALTYPGFVSPVPPEIRSITTWGNVFLEELTSSPLAKKFPAFNGN